MSEEELTISDPYYRKVAKRAPNLTECPECGSVSVQTVQRDGEWWEICLEQEMCDYERKMPIDQQLRRVGAAPLPGLENVR